MKKIVSVISFVLILVSCNFYKPEFRGGESISNVKIEGREIKLDAGAKIYNPNKYSIKVKPSLLDVYVDDQHMGKLHLDKKFKMKAKEETQIKAPLTITVDEGAMFRLMAVVAQGNLNVRLKGKVKAGVWFVSKKIDVDETRSLDGLNIDF